jgi:hypothetical protein
MPVHQAEIGPEVCPDEREVESLSIVCVDIIGALHYFKQVLTIQGIFV